MKAQDTREQSYKFLEKEGVIKEIEKAIEDAGKNGHMTTAYVVKNGLLNIVISYLIDKGFRVLPVDSEMIVIYW